MFFAIFARCYICHIALRQPHGFEQSRGFDQTEGEVKTTALFKTMGLEHRNKTKIPRDYQKFTLNGSDAKQRDIQYKLWEVEWNFR